MKFNPSDTRVAEIVKRLRDDEVGWLTTVHDGTPRPVPVWFLWDGDRELLVYSSEAALKTKTIETHPQCSFHFNSTPEGGDVAILNGRIRRGSAIPLMLENSVYMAKYLRPLTEHAAEANTTQEAISNEYRVPLVMTIEEARGW
jgi:PPOX class probable F420-dependent enzyme